MRAVLPVLRSQHDQRRRLFRWPVILNDAQTCVRAGNWSLVLIISLLPASNFSAPIAARWPLRHAVPTVTSGSEPGHIEGMDAAGRRIGLHFGRGAQAAQWSARQSLIPKRSFGSDTQTNQLCEFQTLRIIVTAQIRLPQSGLRAFARLTIRTADDRRLTAPAAARCISPPRTRSRCEGAHPARRYRHPRP